MLYAQTRDFTYDLALLRFDDAIDSISMSQYVIHTKGIRGGRKGPDLNDKPLHERIKEGRPLVVGLPVLSGVTPSDLTHADVAALMDKAYVTQQNRTNNKYSRRRPNVTDNPIFGSW